MKCLAGFVLVILCAATAAQAAGPVVIAAVPTTATVGIGAQFDVVIQVQAGGQQVDSAAGYIDFDHTILQVVSITAGTTLPVVLSNSFNNTAGTLNYSAGIFSGFPTGTFTLATVRFSTIALTAGTPLAFHSTLPRQTIATFGGASVFDHAVDGTVIVNASTPTRTITPTATRTATPTATVTRTPGGPTDTPGPTATPTGVRPACCGDCGNKGFVSTSDMATCLSILSGALPLSTCRQCDCDADGEVFVADLTLAGLNKANGCPPAPESPLPWTVNPADAPARVVGHLNCRGSVDRACLQTTVLDDHPASVIEGDLWVVNTGSAHQLCYGAGGRRFCCSAEEE